MKSSIQVFTLLCLTCLFGLTSCQRSSGQVWDDTCTAGSYMGKGFRSAGGKHSDSRQVQCRDDFECYELDDSCYDAFGFVPLQDEQGDALIAMENIQQSPFSPGDPGSPIPGIEAFSDPAYDSTLNHIFSTIHFPYNSELIKGEKNTQILQNEADYLRANPNVFVFIEGHCDERGPEKFNLSLGNRRANSVRKFLVDEGVNPKQLFTISYGKERPVAIGNDEAAWSLNRRAEFKIYRR